MRMARRKKRADLFAPLDPLNGYPEMMSAQDIAEFAGIAESSALKWIQEHGGVVVVKGKVRNTWRIAKEYVRQGFNLPRISA